MSNDAVRAAVKHFVQQEAGFAQVTTIADGYPTGRTMGAQLADDWSVDLVQRDTPAYRRVDQVRANPAVEVVWVDYKRDVVVPRVVFMRGNATAVTGDRLLAAYRRIRARLAARGMPSGSGHGGDRSDEDVLANLVCIHIEPVRFRVEGFADGTQVISWQQSAV